MVVEVFCNSRVMSDPGLVFNISKTSLMGKCIQILSVLGQKRLGQKYLPGSTDEVSFFNDKDKRFHLLNSDILELIATHK